MGHQLLPDGQADFTTDPQIAVEQQAVIRQNTACDRIFDRHQTGVNSVIAAHLINQYPEAGAWCDHGGLAKVLLHRFMMKTSRVTLNGNVHKIKKSRPRGPGYIVKCE